jgi:hypothetical protein
MCFSNSLIYRWNGYCQTFGSGWGRPKIALVGGFVGGESPCSLARRKLDGRSFLELVELAGSPHFLTVLQAHCLNRFCWWASALEFMKIWSRNLAFMKIGGRYSCFATFGAPIAGQCSCETNFPMTILLQFLTDMPHRRYFGPAWGDSTGSLRLRFDSEPRAMKSSMKSFQKHSTVYRSWLSSKILTDSGCCAHLPERECWGAIGQCWSPGPLWWRSHLLQLSDGCISSRTMTA